MAISRKKILEKIVGKQKGIDYHLDKHLPQLIDHADRGLVDYWRKEVGSHIDSLESWARRLSNSDDVLLQAVEYRRRLTEMLDGRLRDLKQ